jgi:hypothetical protein
MKRGVAIVSSFILFRNDFVDVYKLPDGVDDR